MAENDDDSAADEQPVEAEQAVDDPGGAPLAGAEVQGWKGHRLDEISGASVGKVEGVYVDEPGGAPEWLLSRMGRFGHHCLVPARDAVGGVGRVWVPYTRDQIRRAPRIDAGKPLTRDQERKLLEHYGVATEDTGRGADLAERPGDAVSARPA